MAFKQQVAPTTSLALTYHALPDDAQISDHFAPPLLPPIPVESSDQASSSATTFSENGSPVPQKIFTDPESVAAWRQRLANLDETQRTLLLKNSQGEVRDLTAFVERQCAAYQMQSHATKINKFLRPFCRTVGQIMPVITAASSADPYPSSLVVGGVVGLLQISNEFNLYQSEIADWLSKFGQRAEILVDYDLCVFNVDPKVQQALVNIFGDFLDFCQKVLKIYYKKTGEPRNGAKILLKSMMNKFADEFGDITKSFDNHLEIYKEAASRSNTKDIQRTILYLRELTRVIERQRQDFWASQQRQSQMQQRHYRSLDLVNQTIVDSQRQSLIFQDQSRERQIQKDSQKREEEIRNARKQILDWLQPVHFARVKDERREGVLEDSGKWIFRHEKYATWKNSEGSDLLWVTGNPGTGKSVLSTVVCDELTTQLNTRSSVAVIDFPCSSTDPQRSEYKVLLTHLLREAVSQCPVLPKEARILFEKDGFRGLESTIKELEDTLAKSFSYFDVIYLILDGVDEFEESKRLLLLKFLTSLLSNAKSILKLIIFSRDYVKGQSTLKKYPNIQVEEANKEDISTFISEKIEGLNPEWEEGMVNIVTTMLSKSANGMYMYVRLMINTLAGDLTTSEIVQRLNKLPEGLPKAYEANMERVMKKSVGLEDKLLICRILFWLANSRRPLTPTELLEALSIKIGAKSIKDSDRRRSHKTFAQRCDELIKLQQDGCYHLAHESLREYLLDMGDTIPLDLKIYADLQSNAGPTIGNTCLTYLLLLPSEKDHFDSREERDSFQQRHPFFNYAAKFWGDHLAASSESNQDDLVWKFLQSGNIFNLAAQVLLDDDITWTVPESFTTLHMIAYFGLIRVAKQDLELKEMQTIVDSIGRTPLDYALFKLRKEMSMWLIEAEEGLPSKKLARSYSALHTAVQMKALDMLNLCIAKDFDIDERAGGDDQTALMLAAEAGSEEALRLLLDNGADADLVDNKKKNALMYALESGNREVAMILLPRTEGIDIQDSGGFTPLHAAARIGAVEIVRDLLKRKCRLLPANDKGWSYTPLHEAIEYDRLEALQELHKYDPNLEVTYKDGFRPIHLAAAGNCLKVARYLVENGVERNPRAPDGKTTLHIAAEQGHNEFIEFLLEKPLDLNVVNDASKETALHGAASYGHGLTCQLLLDGGAQVDPVNKSNQTPLYLSIINAHLKVAKLLLSRDADPMIPGALESPGLHYAAHFGHTELIRDLIAKGSNPKAVNKYKATALHFAAREGQSEFIEQLFAAVAEGPEYGQLEAGPEDSKGNTPIHKVFEKDSPILGEQVRLNIIKLLEKRGCRSDVKNSFSNLPIHLAVWDGCCDIFEYLFKKEILNAQGYFGRTSLCMSIIRGHQGLMKRLLKLGADLEIVDDNGCTPLMLAVAVNKEEIVSILLEHDAITKTYDKTKRNLLHRASENGNLGLVKRFIELRCDVQAKNNIDESPFMLAVYSNNLELVEHYLKEVKVNVDDSDRAGCRPIHVAAAAGNLALFTRLLKAGADAKAKDLLGRDAMMYAASNGRHWLVRPLIMLGLTVNPQERIDVTPLMSASDSGWIHFVQVLLQNGADVNTTLERNGDAALHYAAKFNKLKIIRYLLDNGGDKFQKDKFGLSPLDYARNSKPTLEALGASIDETKTLLQEIAMEPVWKFLHTNIAILVTLPTENQVEVMNQRLLHSVNVLHALTISKDISLHPQLKTLHMRLGFPTEADAFSAARQCYFCWRSLGQTSFLACSECPDRYLCSDCHENCQKGLNGLKTPPEGFVKLMQLELSVCAFRSAILKKLRVFSLLKVMNILVGVSSLTKDFINKKQSEYEEWDEIHGSNNYDLRRRPGQQLINFLFEAKEIYDKTEITDELKTQWALVEKKSTDIRRDCDIDVDEPDDLSCCEHQYFEISKGDVEKIRENRTIFDADGNLTAEWWGNLLKACTDKDVKPEMVGHGTDVEQAKRGETNAPGDFRPEEISSSPNDVSDGNLSTAQTPQKEANTRANKIRDFGLQIIQSQTLGKGIAPPEHSGSMNAEQNAGNLETQGEEIQSAEEAKSSAPALKFNNPEGISIKRSLTRQFLLSEKSQGKKPGRQGSLPLQPVMKPAIVRRSTTPFFTQYKKPVILGVAGAPVALFDITTSAETSTAGDATSDDKNKRKDNADQEEKTPIVGSDGICEEPEREEAEAPTVSHDNIEATESKDAQISDTKDTQSPDSKDVQSPDTKETQNPDPQEASNIKVIAALENINMHGFDILEALEIGEILQPGHTRGFMASRIQEGDAEEYGLRLITRVADVKQGT